MLKKILMAVGVVALAGAIAVGATAEEIGALLPLAIAAGGVVLFIIGLFKKDA